MSIDTFRMSLLELESHLENNNIKSELEEEQFDLDSLNSAITNYLDNLEKIKDATLLSALESKVKDLVFYSSQKNFNLYIHDFKTRAKFVIKNLPTFKTDPKKNIKDSGPKDLIEVMQDKLEKIQKDNLDIEKKTKQFHEIFEKAKSLDSTIKAVVEKAELGASTSHWGKKRTNHKTKFFWFSAISVVLIIVLMCALFYFVARHSFDLSTLSLYVFIIFASSSVFWIIRITVKIALSNLHLSEDAYERFVMIQTYLSFVQEGEIDEKDKELILSSLFRPSNIGIIKDESSVTVTDIITAFKK